MPGRLALVGGTSLPPDAGSSSGNWAAERPTVGVVVAPMGARDEAPQFDELVVIRDRTGADDPAVAARVHRCGLIGICGSDAAFISRTLRGTRAWRSIVEAWHSGATLVGFAEGATALGGYVPDVRNPAAGGAAGLGIVPTLRALSQFDARSRMIPDSALVPLLVDGATVVGIDSSAVLLADPPDAGDVWQFRPRGATSTWRIERDRRYRVNSALRLRVSA